MSTTPPYESADYDTAFMSFVNEVEHVQSEALGNWMVEKFNPQTVVDLGCASGLYLLPYKRAGAQVWGVDMSEDGGKLLDENEYARLDLRFPLPYVTRGSADLVICFEVAEHLHEEYANGLVANICFLAKSLILFTGATPGQGGTNHHNEQPHEYWLSKFREYGWCVRPPQGEMREMLKEFEPMRNKEVSGWIIDNSFLLQRIN